MTHQGKKAGFSLIELLFVVAILGIISAIAIPSFLGQRARARAIGDAQSNAQMLRMQLETAKADSGIYGPAQAYNWTTTVGAGGYSGAADANMAASFPSYTPNTHMTINLVIANAGLTYIITVMDPTEANAHIYKIDQTGTVLPLP